MSRRQPRGEYIETVLAPMPHPSIVLVLSVITHNFSKDTGNKVSRKAILVGTQNIMLGGKSVIQQDAMIRGDLARQASSSSSSGGTAVALGRYCFVSKGAILRPPGRIYKGHVSFSFFFFFFS